MRDPHDWKYGFCPHLGMGNRPLCSECEPGESSVCRSSLHHRVGGSEETALSRLWSLASGRLRALRPGCGWIPDSGYIKCLWHAPRWCKQCSSRVPMRRRTRMSELSPHSGETLLRDTTSDSSRPACHARSLTVCRVCFRVKRCVSESGRPEPLRILRPMLPFD